MSAWIEQIFDAASAEKGNVVRRSIADVQKYASRIELTNAVKAKSFHLIETGDQFVIICNAGELKIWC